MGQRVTGRLSEDAREDASPATCSRCGAEHVAGARFCAQCGLAVGAAAPPPALASLPALVAAPLPARPAVRHPANASHPLPPGAVRDPRYFALLAWLMMALYACPVCNPHRLVGRHATDGVCGWCGGTGWVRRS